MKTCRQVLSWSMQLHVKYVKLLCSCRSGCRGFLSSFDGTHQHCITKEMQYFSNVNASPNFLFTSERTFCLHGLWFSLLIILRQKQQLSSVPTLALTDTEGEHKSIPLPPSPREETSELVTQRDDIVTAEKMTFLTEEMATSEGEFSKRHNAPGCSSSLARVKKGPSRGNRTRGSLSAPASSMSTREEKKSQVKHWEPLSVNALLEYNLDSLRAPGSGEFLFGKSKTWKIQ